jgi:DNA-binding transcriptional MerR regulator
LTRSYLQIEPTEDFTSIKKLLNAQNEPDGLMNLIRNPQFEFDLNLSSRMLNYHESNGLIRFHREGTAGKRRFSLANALGFQFSLYLKRMGLNNDEIAQFNEVLNRRDERGISDWDLVVYIGSLTISQVDIWIKRTINLIPGMGKGREIELTTDENEDFFHLSKELRETFFNGQGNISLNGKTASFLPRFVLEIDKVRDHLGWEKLSSDNFKLVKEFGEEKAEKFIDSNAVMALNQLPPSEYTKIYDIIHRNEKGNYFGIEIKYLKIKPKTRFQSDKLTTNMEELKQAIEVELKFLEKMREKINKGGLNQATF